MQDDVSVGTAGKLPSTPIDRPEAEPKLPPRLPSGSVPVGFDVLAKLSRAITFFAEHLAACIALAIACILLAGVTSRYVFNQPLHWSDEVASFLFVWLTMLGSIIALARNGHLRLTAMERRAGPRTKTVLKLASGLLIFVMLGWMLMASGEHLEDAYYSINPMLHISDAWRSGAMNVGLALLAVVSFAQVVIGARGNAAELLIALASVTAAAAALYGLSLATGGRYDLVLFFLVAGSACVLIGMPIAFAFGLAALAFLNWTTSIPMSIVVGRFEAGMSHLILLSVPMFIVLGLMFEMTGMARSMIAFLASLVGHLRGGLSFVMLGAMYLVSGISGAKAADMAAIAPAMVPEMRRRGVPDSELVSLLAGASAMSETIPPSLVLITVGVVTGVSIGSLFAAGLLPALALALLMCVVARYNAGRDNLSMPVRATWATTSQAFFAAIPGLILPIVIRTAVVEGVATATEVATIGVVYILVAALVVYRRFDLARFYEVLKESATLSGAIMIILGAANAVSWALTQTGFSQDLASRITSMPGGAAGFMAMSILLFVVFGSLLEGIPALVIFGPLLFPIARSMGIHEVQYAMVAVLAMGVGLYMPPFGVGYYTACAISRIDPSAGMLRIWPYLGVLILGVTIVAAVPWISTGFLSR
ncbi:TRAP transporter large permease subunit [Bosea psychrotolerans]|uniref:Tripartite ATP-independent transporter DctM subunit n=1 Tax=Bosea psychrotolerans TaxID=1871628 RepID=A0A2S4MB18_9HYPH|nr:TRAP transporter large permease subunit [Bosea psychrotolerans]POR51950.1 tripartite ATP-independent transporter DctM subunit [Bosea psychrotolerans]